MKRIAEIRIEFEEEMEMGGWILPIGLAAAVLVSEYNTFLCFFGLSLFLILIVLMPSLFSRTYFILIQSESLGYIKSFSKPFDIK